MNKFLINAEYYLIESKNVENDLVTRKECCELAYENFLLINDKDYRTKKITEIKQVLKEISNESFNKGVDIFNELNEEESFQPDKLNDKSLDKLNLAIKYLENAKQCGNKDCAEILKECKKLFVKLKKQKYNNRIMI